MKAKTNKSITPVKIVAKFTAPTIATQKKSDKTGLKVAKEKGEFLGSVEKNPKLLAPKKALVNIASKAPRTKVDVGKPVMVAKKISKKIIKIASSLVAKSPAKAVKPSKIEKKILLNEVARHAEPASALSASKKSVKPVMAPAPLSTPRPVEKTMLIPVPPVLKPGRRSSARALSHMPPPAPMVPTHAPDAAKASYSTMTERVIAPPPHVAAKKDPKLANNWKVKSAEELTDDEIKAMPDAEYMNEKQMAFFRYKLAILKQEIHNSAGETTEHLREDTVVVPDPADRATIEEEHALELRTRDRERKLLKKIEQSIARIDSGDYGYCDETGESIGVGRLIARPTANLSLEAQQRRELKQKMFGD